MSKGIETTALAKLCLGILWPDCGGRYNASQARGRILQRLTVRQANMNLAHFIAACYQSALLYVRTISREEGRQQYCFCDMPRVTVRGAGHFNNSVSETKEGGSFFLFQ